MRKILLDCGAHCGCTVRKFRSEIDLQNEYEIISFEPSDKLHKFYDNNLGILYSKAVWSFDGVITLHEFGKDGGSTVSNAKAIRLRERKPYHPNVLAYQTCRVSCISLAKFIETVFLKEDYIILKLDIEGAEYEVLDHLCKNDILEYINEIYIEWHATRMGQTTDQDVYFEDLFKSNGIVVNNQWDAMLPKYCYSKGKNE